MFGIGRIGGGEAGLAAADVVPVGQSDAADGQAVARAAGGADVLDAAGDAIGHAVVAGDVIELADRQRRGVPASGRRRW